MAYLASVGPLSSVRLHVSLQTGFLTKDPHTNIASKLTLHVVDALVRIQVLLLRKSLEAHLTLEWSLPKMYSFVSSQILTLSE